MLLEEDILDEYVFIQLQIDLHHFILKLICEFLFSMFVLDTTFEIPPELIITGIPNSFY
jgi:hypothetical protein